LVPAGGVGLDNVEAFAIGQTAFLILPDPIAGNARLLRVQEEGGALSLAELPVVNITKGWDVFEAFKSSGTWYLFGFKRRTYDVGVEERGGTARMWKPLLGTSGEFGMSWFYTDYWGLGLTGMSTFTDSLGHGYMITWNSDTLQTSVAQLGSDENAFINDINPGGPTLGGDPGVRGNAPRL
jgi:hypothetical protein